MKEMTGSSWRHGPDAPSSSSSQPQIPPLQPALNRSDRNLFHLLVRREISPRTRHTPKRLWGEAFKLNSDSLYRSKSEAARDARHGLFSWVEAESLRHLSAKYCPLVPPPRSTIAAAFSPDGRTLASTHGDHTVKIIDCHTGSCLKVLSGHRRTPWVVRFHPLYPEILASGSLDHEVRLWDANTSDCIGSRDFYRPIASIAFHAKGELLAVASGHKLYMWHYNARGEGSSPTMVLKTKRSLRAVHFHPHGAPFLLTAEVNDLDSSDSSMTQATSVGYLRYPPPAVFMSNVHSRDPLTLAAELPFMSFPFLFLPSNARDDSRTDLQNDNRLVGSSSIQVESSSVQFQTRANTVQQNDDMACPMETSPVIPSGSYHGTEDAVNNYFPNGLQNGVGDPTCDAMETTEVQSLESYILRSTTNLDAFAGANSSQLGAPGQISGQQDSVPYGQINQFLPCRDPSCWELPFLQGWLMGQSQAGIPAMLPSNGSANEYLSRYSGLNSTPWTDLSARNVEASTASLAMPGGICPSGISGRSSLRNRLRRIRLVSISDSREGAASMNGIHDGSNTQPILNRIQTELATSLAAAAAAELPCTVKLRIWPHDIKNPCAILDVEKCRLTIPHAVLCSEMGAHFSPCGRYLAACVACMLPHSEVEPGLQMQIHHESTGSATSPTRHPITAHQVVYELRIYSLEEATFGSVLVSRAIRAAHCLTSIQFSPTSEHILLAYGRRHSSLLKSVVVDGETTIPIYTILEIYRVSDMELVGVLPSAEDEVNVACFHPLAGGGLVYGTKEGKLRVLQYDSSHGMNCAGANFVLQENMVEVDQYAKLQYVLAMCLALE
ncbi:uncharacterized protein LOC131155156 isoform X2 [Malania oleifera]|uniref:uncharacterized protein LOC131155156 isoform X2 n=1 Tax=Malania oleifera TaxID=397392 RepID=UPI0025AE4231|nr:uncharacterized protein LOC131155156 isoform X2 [Malania oleifera]